MKKLTFQPFPFGFSRTLGATRHGSSGGCPPFL